MEAFLDKLNSLIISPVMVWVVVLVGIVLTIKTGFIQFRRLGFTLKYTFSQMFKKSDKNAKTITPFQAVATALSGTLGTGNIAGVATAVAIGGPGAIFWMWVSSFLGMATKYSEIVLSMKYRKKQKDGSYLGGPMYYIEKAMGNKKLASIFAALCLLSSFGIGNMTQSNTAAIAIKTYLPISDFYLRLSVIIVAVIIGFVIIGGIKRIAKITSSLIPAMALFYIGSCILIICMDYKNVGNAFKIIIQSAFNLKSAAGGVLGYGMITALKIGFARGVFTNEAGLGSAPIAHAAAENKLPALQGLWGIFEVFFDTIVMCTLTGVVIVLSGLYQNTALNSSALTLKAFSLYIGDFSATLIAISTVFFAVATIISWSYYGETCIKYLFNSKFAVMVYKIIYIFAIYLGAVTTANIVWGVSDLLNTLMMIPNLIGVILLVKVVKTETNVLNNEIKNNKKHKHNKK